MYPKGLSKETWMSQFLQKCRYLKTDLERLRSMDLVVTAIPLPSSTLLLFLYAMERDLLHVSTACSSVSLSHAALVRLRLQRRQANLYWPCWWLSSCRSPPQWSPPANARRARRSMLSAVCALTEVPQERLQLHAAVPVLAA
jgi:hypothetical protein